MTDRIKGLIVTLDSDYREDDVQQIVDAISMIKGVLLVDKNVADINDHINRTRVRSELVNELFATLRKEK